MVAAQYIYDLVRHQFFDGGPGRLQVLPGIKLLRMILEKFTNRACHGQTQIGVDVDLADSQRGCLSELLFWDAYSIGHFPAILVHCACAG